MYLATLDETPVAAKALVPLRAGLHGYKATASLTERELEKFHRECSILASVSHPNVVQVRGAGQAAAGVLGLLGPVSGDAGMRFSQNCLLLLSVCCCVVCCPVLPRSTLKTIVCLPTCFVRSCWVCASRLPSLSWVSRGGEGCAGLGMHRSAHLTVIGVCIYEQEQQTRLLGACSAALDLKLFCASSHSAWPRSAHPPSQHVLCPPLNRCRVLREWQPDGRA